MNRYLCALLILVIILPLAGCASPTPAPATAVLPTNTSIPTPTDTLEPTATPEPTPTTEPTAISVVSTEAIEIDEYLTKLQAQNSLFNGVILIASDGKILLHKAYGLADSKNSIPLAIDTVMPVLGADFYVYYLTTATILLMADQGKLSLADPICPFIADCPKTWDAITIKDVLQSTSGLPNPLEGLTGEEMAKLVNSTTSFEQSIALIRDKPLVTIQAPATAHWSWANYLIQFRIISETLKDTDNRAYILKNLLKPLGITYLGGYISKDVAAGHDGSMNPTNISPLHQTIHYPYWMISNAKEIYLLLQELIDPKILSESTGKFIRTEGSFDNFPITGNFLGVTNSGLDFPGSFYSWDFPGGYSGVYLVSPEDQLIIVICSNQKGKDYKTIINFIATKIYGKD